jgi:hypothetical protein
MRSASAAISSIERASLALPCVELYAVFGDAAAVARIEPVDMPSSALNEVETSA